MPFRTYFRHGADSSVVIEEIVMSSVYCISYVFDNVKLLAHFPHTLSPRCLIVFNAVFFHFLQNNRGRLAATFSLMGWPCRILRLTGRSFIHARVEVIAKHHCRRQQEGKATEDFLAEEHRSGSYVSVRRWTSECTIPRSPNICQSGSHAEDTNLGAQINWTPYDIFRWWRHCRWGRTLSTAKFDLEKLFYNLIYTDLHVNCINNCSLYNSI